MNTNRPSGGVRQCERALELDRNLASTRTRRSAQGEQRLGRAEETEAHVQEALRRVPRDMHSYLCCMFAGLAKFQLGQEEEAIGWMRRSIDANRSFPSSYFRLAALHWRVSAGSLKHGLRPKQDFALNPAFTIARFRAGATIDEPFEVAVRERYVDGLRKAGVPEEISRFAVSPRSSPPTSPASRA